MTAGKARTKALQREEQQQLQLQKQILPSVQDDK
jgi:hypothetical protein